MWHWPCSTRQLPTMAPIRDGRQICIWEEVSLYEKHPWPENHRKSTKMDKKHYLGRFHSKKTGFCKVGRIRAKTRHNKQHKAAFNFKRSSTTRDGKVGHARICRVATVVFVRWLVRCMSFLLTKPCMSQHKHFTTRLETVRLKQTKMLAVQCVHCLITYRESWENCWRSKAHARDMPHFWPTASAQPRCTVLDPDLLSGPPPHRSCWTCNRTVMQTWRPTPCQ